jgi:hypothetical protein
LTRPIVDREDGALRQWRLLEGDGGRATRPIELRDRDVDEVARLEEIGRRAFRAGPT